MTMNTNISAVILGLAVLLAGCAGPSFQPPPLSATNPASVEAKESVTSAAKPMLGRDALTRKTDEQLASSAPGTPSVQPSEMQKMPHDMSNMAGMQHDNAGAMKKEPGEKKPTSERSYYTCVMHPQIHQDKPGKCPICGMTLIKKEEGQK